MHRIPNFLLAKVQNFTVMSARNGKDRVVSRGRVTSHRVVKTAPKDLVSVSEFNAPRNI